MAQEVVSKRELLKRLEAGREQIRACGVRRLSLFGSFARGEARPESDVDFVVEFAEGRKTYDRFMDLSFLLEELLERPVEVITRESLDPYLGPRILQEAEDVALGS